MSGLFFNEPVQLQDDFYVLKRFVETGDLLKEIKQIVNQAPLRKLTVPGGKTMSVAMTNCGNFGWISDAQSYRYSATDPNSQRPWPAIPAALKQVATQASAGAVVGVLYFTVLGQCQNLKAPCALI